MKKCFSDEQIISILREAEAGVSSRELCRKHAIFRRYLLYLAQEVRRHGSPRSKAAQVT